MKDKVIYEEKYNRPYPEFDSDVFKLPDMTTLEVRCTAAAQVIHNGKECERLTLFVYTKENK
ncbi:MAG: hypothetical protein ACFFDN_09180 [Candidatus Hodarchaeota archaeon]